MQGWCESVVVSFPSSLVVFFRVPFLRALVFVQKTFCDFFLLGFFVVVFFLFVILYCCLGMVREKRGRRGGQGEDACMVYKV